MNLDLAIHGAEALAIVFWIGVSYGDLRWIKAEIIHLRHLIEINFGVNTGELRRRDGRSGER